MRQHRLSFAVVLPGVASADATDDYPIPHRMIITTRTAEHILAAARDFTPIYYERYIIDKHNKPPGVQQAAMDRAHSFYSLSSADRRAYAEEMATNIYGEPRAFPWPNWAKIFFNNKGVAAKKPKIAPATRRTMNPSGTVDFMCPENTAIDRSLRAASALLRGTSKSKRSQSNGHMHQ
jgi:Domain of unknown function (DUF5078)